MKNVNRLVIDYINNNNPVYTYAEITLKDGTSLTLNSTSDFTVSGNSYGESFSGSFPFGEAVVKTLNISFDNSNGYYDDFDFMGATITLKSETDLVIGGSQQTITEGIFIVYDWIIPSQTIELKAYNRMYEFNKETTTQELISLFSTFPQTGLSLRNFARYIYGKVFNITNAVVLSLRVPAFINGDYVFAKTQSQYQHICEALEGKTYKDILGYIAQFAGGNAYITDNSNLTFKSYYDVDPKYFEAGLLGSSVANSLNGGVLNDNTSNHNVSKPLYENILLDNYMTDITISRQVYNIYSIRFDCTCYYKVTDSDGGIYYELDTYPTTISRTTIPENQFNLVLDNPLAYYEGNRTLNAEGEIISDIVTSPLDIPFPVIASNVLDYVKDIGIRKFSGIFTPNPLIELMDKCYLVTTSNKVYTSYITEHSYNYLESSEVSNNFSLDL